MGELSRAQQLIQKSQQFQAQPQVGAAPQQPNTLTRAQQLVQQAQQNQQPQPEEPGLLSGLATFVKDAVFTGDNAATTAGDAFGTTAGAAAGFALGGPPGAVAGGIIGGTLTPPLFLILKRLAGGERPPGFTEVTTEALLGAIPGVAIGTGAKAASSVGQAAVRASVNKTTKGLDIVNEVAKDALDNHVNKALQLPNQELATNLYKALDDSGVVASGSDLIKKLTTLEPKRVKQVLAAVEASARDGDVVAGKIRSLQKLVASKKATPEAINAIDFSISELESIGQTLGNAAFRTPITQSNKRLAFQNARKLVTEVGDEAIGKSGTKNIREIASQARFEKFKLNTLGDFGQFLHNKVKVQPGGSIRINVPGIIQDLSSPTRAGNIGKLNSNLKRLETQTGNAHGDIVTFMKQLDELFPNASFKVQDLAIRQGNSFFVPGVKGLFEGFGNIIASKRGRDFILRQLEQTEGSITPQIIQLGLAATTNTARRAAGITPIQDPSQLQGTP